MSKKLTHDEVDRQVEELIASLEKPQMPDRTAVLQKVLNTARQNQMPQG
jgi:hypothetical protein